MKDVIYESKDKQIVPFLLTRHDISFTGTRVDGFIVYFQFFPLVRCQELVNAFISGRAPLVQPKELLDAVESFRSMVFEKRRN